MKAAAGTSHLRAAGTRLGGRIVCALGLALAATPLAACTGPAGSAGSGPLTYYVSPSGNDAADGTSPATAWRSLDRASSAALRPGTRLLLQGGQRFRGHLTLNHLDAGNARRPVIVSSYGKGRATIVTPRGSGMVIFNTAGVDVRGVRVSGQQRTWPSGSGINMFSNLPGNRKLSHIAIEDVDVSGFAYGISVGGGRGTTGFRDVFVQNSALHDNLDAGLVTYGPAFDAASPSYANEDVRISHVTAFHNRGDPRLKAYSSGSGIILGSVRNGTVAWSTAYANGGAGGSVPGPEGIWAYDSTKIDIEHNVSYRNRTANRADGNGFGLDQNTSGSYLQYNLSYGNDGAGYLVYTGVRNGATTHDVLRFNISSGDAQGQGGHFGGITVNGRVHDIAVYQNTVVMQSPPHAFALVLGRRIHGTTVRNNIFLNQTGPMVVANVALTPPAALLQGNDYFSAASPWTVLWGPATFDSLSAWQSSTGQELVSGHPSGFAVDPQLPGPFTGLRDLAASQAGMARPFTLGHSSPLAGAGLDLAGLFGLDPGPQNYAGSPVSGKAPNVGAL
jgi:hypothetical protein